MARKNAPPGSLTLRDVSGENFFCKTLKYHYDVLLRISNFRFVTYIYCGESSNTHLVSCSNLPLEVKRNYSQKNLVAIDPIIGEARSRSEPFFFSEIADCPDFARIAEAGRAGGLDFNGYVVPVSHGRKRGLVCFTDTLEGDAASVRPDAQMAFRLSLLNKEAQAFHESFCDALASIRGDLCQLSNREDEVLAFLCEGKTQAEIADHIRKSPKSIELYLRNARKKMGARTTSHAVSLYVRMDRDMQ